MFRELLNKFSGGQLTAITLALILVPGAVGAAVTFQSVAIVDPATGKQSYVDKNRRLYVYDPIAGYRNNPANFVEITVINLGNNCETAYQYTVPAGKSLIITAISGFEQMFSNSFSSAGFTIFDGPNCTGSMLNTHYSSISTTIPVTPVAVDMGVGIPVPAGKTISLHSQNNYGYTHLHGYLVPAAAIPAVAAADAADQPKPVTAADFAAKLKHR